MKKISKRDIVILFSGFAGGAIIFALATLIMMPGMMILKYESQAGNVDETTEAIVKSIKDKGWSVIGVSNMNKSLKKHDKDIPQQVRAIKLCHPDYANKVLSDEKARYASCLMPCSIAVYEDNSGKTMIAKMNTGLMGTLFGGTIAEVMGGKVGPDEHRMLEKIVKQ